MECLLFVERALVVRSKRDFLDNDQSESISIYHHVSIPARSPHQQQQQPQSQQQQKHHKHHHFHHHRHIADDEARTGRRSPFNWPAATGGGRTAAAALSLAEAPLAQTDDKKRYVTARLHPFIFNPLQCCECSSFWVTVKWHLPKDTRIVFYVYIYVSNWRQCRAQ